MAKHEPSAVTRSALHITSAICAHITMPNLPRQQPRGDLPCAALSDARSGSYAIHEPQRPSNIPPHHAQAMPDDPQNTSLARLNRTIRRRIRKQSPHNIRTFRRLPRFAAVPRVPMKRCFACAFRAPFVHFIAYYELLISIPAEWSAVVAPSLCILYAYTCACDMWLPTPFYVIM